MDWTEIKNALEAATGLSRDALHIYAALLIQVLAAALLRRRLADWTPWLMVLAFAAANEAFDTYASGQLAEWELYSALHDLWNTMVLPTALLLLTRFAPALAVGAPASPQTGDPPPADQDPPQLATSLDSRD